MKLFNSTGLIALTIVLASCGGSSGNKNPKLTNGEGHEQLQQLVNDQIGPKEIHQIRFSAMEDYNPKLRSFSVNYVENGEIYSQEYKVIKREGEEHLSPLKEMYEGKDDQFMVRNYSSTFKLQDLNFERINRDVNLVLDNMEDDFKSYTIDEYVLEASDSDPDGVDSQITLHYTPQKGATTVEGRAVVTNFYEIKADIDSKGNIEFRN